MDSTVTVVDSALKTGESISNFGMMAVTAGFFLVLSALLMIACFRWFMKLVNMMIENQKQMIENQQKSMQEMMASQQESMQLLLEETKQQNQKLNDISEGLVSETQLRIKTITDVMFDLSVEKVCRIIKRVRQENNIKNREATITKIRTLLTNHHEERNSKLDVFHFRGRRLSTYTDHNWVDKVSKVVEGEIYNESGENNGRAYTNVAAVYDNIKLEFHHNITYK